MRVRHVLAALVLAVGSVLVGAVPASAHPALTITAAPTSVPAGNAVTLTISGKSNGNYTGARIEVFSTGGPGQLTSFTTLGSCGGGTTSCTEITNRYRLGLPNLVTNQNFSYTVTFTVDAGTAATTFTSKAQFYKSDNTTDGPTTGPVITVTNPQADLAVTTASQETSFTPGYFFGIYAVTNNGPGTATGMTVSITVNGPALFPLTFGDPSSISQITDDYVVGTCVDAFPTTTCTFNHPVASGETVDLNIYLQAALLTVGTVTSTVTITSSTPTDPTPANNQATSNACTVATGLIVTC